MLTKTVSSIHGNRYIGRKLASLNGWQSGLAFDSLEVQVVVFQLKLEILAKVMKKI